MLNCERWAQVFLERSIMSKKYCCWFRNVILYRDDLGLNNSLIVLKTPYLKYNISTGFDLDKEHIKQTWGKISQVTTLK